MPPRSSPLQGTLTPFLYPSLCKSLLRARAHLIFCRSQSTSADADDGERLAHLNPPPTDYSRTIFADKATITVHAGNGGHGCISFLKEKYISAGPANGGDGGSGGNVYIQAVRGETSLHKLARRRILAAGRGKNGQGKTRGGERGEDVIIEVPVGTVVREVERVDPVTIEEERQRLEAGKEDGNVTAGPMKWSREKWLLYPAVTPEDIATAEFPRMPKARRSHLVTAQVPGPINLDLSSAMERPLLLAAGAVGGLGNPHFVTKVVPRPKYATRGEEGMSLTIELELKLLADVGLVGLPNAGKSTLLRAMSNSKARVGSWAFTTLQPNIGTVVLDNYRGRPTRLVDHNGEPRTNFTIADIPGLVPDAHLDRGLGISFLKHVERARVLAFVVDLSAGDAISALKSLWREVGLYEKMKLQQEDEKKDGLVNWSPMALDTNYSQTIVVGGDKFGNRNDAFTYSISSKPWFVVATKADLPGTQDNFQKLRDYVTRVSRREEEHPSGQKDSWVEGVQAVPISAINGHGVERITDCTVSLLSR